jgi:hypothetical protein
MGLLMRKRYQRQKLGDLFDVMGYIPPAELQAIAKERTSGMQAAFIHLGGRAAHVARFARSCYMQGVNDAADALVQTGHLKAMTAGPAPSTFGDGGELVAKDK